MTSQREQARRVRHLQEALVKWMLSDPFTPCAHGDRIMDEMDEAAINVALSEHEILHDLRMEHQRNEEMSLAFPET